MKYDIEKGIAKWVAIFTRRQKKEDRKKPVTYKVSDILKQEALFRLKNPANYPWEHVLSFEMQVKRMEELRKSKEPSND